MTRDLTPFEQGLQQMLDQLQAMLAHDTDRMQAIAALQGRVYSDIDGIIRQYVRDREELLTGYRSHVQREQQQ